MKRRRGESGFALLLVFAMAAAVALLLYMELPRVAFEAQRSREMILIDRGEQYKRGIQLYFRKFRRFPASLDQLEDTNSIRFLRRRYRDPITGKDEWRLIHIGPGGLLTDSLTQTPPGSKKEEAAATEAGKTSGGQETPSAATRRRASEMGGPVGGAVPQEGAAAQADPTEPGTEASATALSPGGDQPVPPGQSNPPQAPPEPGAEPQVSVPYVVPGQTPYSYPQVQPGQPYPYQPSPAQPGGQPYFVQSPQLQPGQASPYTQMQGYPVPPVSLFPGQPGAVQIQLGRPGTFSPVIPQPGQPASSQTGGQSPTPYYPGMAVGPPPAPTETTSSPYTRRPGLAGQPSNAALEMIQRILTTPRPGGLGQPVTQQPITYGTGIAGVASKAEADSIIIYNERTRYNEWEFIYDLRKDRSAIGPVGLTGAPAGNLLTPPQSGSSSGTLFTPTAPASGRGGRGR